MRIGIVPTVLLLFSACAYTSGHVLDFGKEYACCKDMTIEKIGGADPSWYRLTGCNRVLYVSARPAGKGKACRSALETNQGKVVGIIPCKIFNSFY